MRAALMRYRRLPFVQPDDQIVALLDRDGPELARETLRRLGEPVEAPRGSLRRWQGRARATLPIAAETRVAVPAPRAAPRGGRWPLAGIAALMGIALGLAWWHRARGRLTSRRRGSR
jgi:hypothetical protein